MQYEDHLADERHEALIDAIERGARVAWTKEDRTFIRYADNFWRDREAPRASEKRRRWQKDCDVDPYLPDDIQNDPRPREDRGDFPLFKD